MIEEHRIKPEEIVQAYKSRNLRMHQGGYYHITEDHNCACGLGAFYAHRFYPDEDLVEIKDDHSITDNLDSYFGSEEYRYGFIVGFDDRDDHRMSVTWEKFGTEDRRKGYEDGCAARKAVVMAGLITAEIRARYRGK